MNQKVLLAIVILIGIFVAILFMIRVTFWLQWFFKELDYLNKEIARTAGKERERWIARKRRLIFWWFPFK